MPSIRRAVSALLLAAAASAASAATITYDFSLTISSGPLLGQAYSGSFGYDDSIVAPGVISGTGLLSAFNFGFDGHTYTLADADTGLLEFDALGVLTDFEIGNDCGVGGCNVTPGSNDWRMTSFAFFYAQPGDVGSYFSDGPQWALHSGGGSAPEPTSLALVLAAGAFASAFRRRA